MFSLVERLFKRLKCQKTETSSADKGICIALIGVDNAGKSTFLANFTKGESLIRALLNPCVLCGLRIMCCRMRSILI